MFDAQAQHSPQFMLSRPGTFLVSELLRLSRARETMTVTALWIAFLLRDILFYSSFYLFGSDFQQGHTEMPSTCGWQSHVAGEPRDPPPPPSPRIDKAHFIASRKLRASNDLCTEPVHAFSTSVLGLFCFLHYSLFAR